MLCVALVHLPDWPRNEARDVDETDEDIRGKLRAHYIAPLTRIDPEIPVTPLRAEAPQQTAVIEESAESAQTPAQPARRPNAKKRA